MKDFLLIFVFYLFSSFTLHAQENIALNKTATQSSDWGGIADKAVDGNTDGNYYNASITHTNNDPGAWWQVDLGAVYDITDITLYNRTDCCAERLDDFTILVSETPFTDNSGGKAFASNIPYAENPVRAFSGDSRGRYVRVFLSGTGYLSLAEVEVFGQKAHDVSTAAAGFQNTVINTVQSIFPGDLSINEFKVEGTDPNFTVSGYVDLAGGTRINLSAIFSTEIDNSNVQVTGTLIDVTIGQLLQGIGLSSNGLPSEFTGSTIDNLTMILDPIDERLTASMTTGLGQMEISGKKDGGYMIGIRPNNLGNMIGLQDVNSALSGFTLIYSSHPEEEDSSLEDLLSSVKAQNGLNLYWTGSLPGPLKDFLGLLAIPGLNGQKTFACTESLTNQVTLPTLSYPLGRFEFSVLDFNGIALELNLSDASIGLTGNIISDFGGEFPILRFASSLDTKISPPSLEGRISLNQVGNTPGEVWDNAFGIPKVNITELYIGTKIEATNGPSVAYVGGSADIFGLGGTIEVSSTQGVLGMSGELDIIDIKSGGLTYFSLKGTENEKGAAFELNPSSKRGKFNGKVNLLGIESESEVTITPSLLSATTNGSLLGFVEAELTMSAEDFTDFKNSEFTLSGKITQNLDDKIEDLIRGELGAEAALFIGAALETFSIENITIAATSKLSELENSSITLGVEVTVIGFDVPDTEVTLSIKDLKNIDDLAVSIANEVADELEDLAGGLLDELAKAAEQAYLAAKQAFNAAGELVENPGSIANAIGLASSKTTTLEDWYEISPMNGIADPTPIPEGVHQYRVTVQSFKVVDMGEEGGSELEVIGSINISAKNMYLQTAANSLLWYRKSDVSESCAFGNVQDVRYDYSTLNNNFVEIFNIQNGPQAKHYKDFFIGSDMIPSSFIEIELDLSEYDGVDGNNDPFKIKVEKIFPSIYRDLLPGQKTMLNPITLEEDYSGDKQTIEVNISIQRIIQLGGESKSYTIQQKSNGQYMDAHEDSANDFSTVTRPAQNNDSQRWIISPLGDDTYTIQQKSNGRYMDAHEDSENDFSAVTRSAQNNDSQRWIILPLGNDTYTIQQKCNGQYLDASENSGNDFSAVTRPAQNDDSQRWVIKLK